MVRKKGGRSREEDLETNQVKGPKNGVGYNGIFDSLALKPECPYLSVGVFEKKNPELHIRAQLTIV